MEAPARTTPDGLCGMVSPGERLFLAGATGEPTAFVRAMLSDPERTRGWQLTTSFVPGINPVAVENLHPEATLTGLFPQAGSGRYGATARGDTLPVSYHGFVRMIGHSLQFDTVVVHVSPPDEGGMCSLGCAVEFIPRLLTASRRVLAIVNDRVPSMPGSVSLPFDRFEAWCEADDELRSYASGSPDALSNRIAEHVAGLITDNVTLQIGIGKVPTALLHCLTDRRGLRLHSGIVTEAVVALVEARALASDSPSLSCALLGGSDFYKWLSSASNILVRGCEETHDPARLNRLDRLVAVNSGLEVDLLGQANLEQIRGRSLSAPGGAPDFAHAASQSKNGLSVIALPATGPDGSSRIVAQLSSGAPVTLPRHCIDVVVTEHGRADLRGLVTEARGEALISIAAPEARAGLSAEWRRFNRKGIPS